MAPRLLIRSSRRGWWVYVLLPAYGALVWNADPSNSWRGAIAGVLVLSLAQVAYPTKLGWFLSWLALSVIAAMFLFDPFRNMGPGREYGIIIVGAFAMAVYRNCLPDDEGSPARKETIEMNRQ